MRQYAWLDFHGILVAGNTISKGLMISSDICPTTLAVSPFS